MSNVYYNINGGKNLRILKKLSKITLQNAVELENQEMKMIFGGSGVGDRCAYSVDPYHGPIYCIVHGGVTAAQFMAGSGGWWCCNCAEANTYC